VANALSDEMKIIDLGWRWRSVLQQQLATAGFSAAFKPLSKQTTRAEDVLWQRLKSVAHSNETERS